MAGLTIGQVAHQVGLAPSALRYYERAGLLPPPARACGQRRYERSILGRIRIISLARQAGFSIRETREFLAGFSTSATPASRWKAMAGRKLVELDQLLGRIKHMKSVLQASFRCECRQLEDCERWMTR